MCRTSFILCISAGSIIYIWSMNCDCLRKVDIRNFIEVTICCIILSYNLWNKLRSSRSILGFINGFSSYNSVTLLWRTTSWYHDILELFYLLLRKCNSISVKFLKNKVIIGISSRKHQRSILEGYNNGHPNSGKGSCFAQIPE